jgi:hypothetical protein
MRYPRLICCTKKFPRQRDKRENHSLFSLGLGFAKLRTTALVAWQAERPMETELTQSEIGFALQQ